MQGISIPYKKLLQAEKVRPKKQMSPKRYGSILHRYSKIQAIFILTKLEKICWCNERTLGGLGSPGPVEHTGHLPGGEPDSFLGRHGHDAAGKYIFS